MKKGIFLFLFVFCSLPFATANGVCIINADDNSHFPLLSSDIQALINNQIATVTVTQTFINNTNADTTIKFAYPMSETASALQLRWNNFNTWYTADFSPNPQDTIVPGDNGGPSGPATIVAQYLGDYPLFFNLEQHVPAGEKIIFEITYVDLLPYAFNVVEFFHPNDYSLIQSSPLDSFSLQVNLLSERTIDWIDLKDFNSELVSNSGHEATLTFSQNNFPLTENIIVEYQLNADELGLFSFSTYVSDTLLHCDEEGNGYMAFIVEPDPSESAEVIEKVFTLIIDESGSMTGSKIEQARDAASFIVEHLNLGDEFNIVAFDSDITTFKPNHVPFNATTEAEALNFISALVAIGATNISGAFSSAIPNFSNSDPDKAKIIIFFTDGEATAGITSTNGILSHVETLVNNANVPDLSIFTFGIGAGANQQLLTLLALQNNGLSEFLGAEELLTSISNFYLKIQNPVLLSTDMFFDPDLVTETYPNPLPNLFKGQQLIVVGRYEEPVNVDVHFSGTAFGEEVNFNYPISLSDTLNPVLQFLPRLWAKKKIENLYIQFFSAGSGTPEAMALEDSIINLSLCYGVISPFTSFEDNTGSQVAIEETYIEEDKSKEIRVFPNPFYQRTTMSFVVPDNLLGEDIVVEIWNSAGVLVLREELTPDSDLEKIFNWDGLCSNGEQAAQGMYFAIIRVGELTYRARLLKMG